MVSNNQAFMQSQEDNWNLEHPHFNALAGPEAGASKKECCSSCKKVFKRKGDLLRHEKIHSPDKFFLCYYEECDWGKFSFSSRKDKLVDHVVNRHKESRETANRIVNQWNPIKASDLNGLDAITIGRAAEGDLNHAGITDTGHFTNNSISYGSDAAPTSSFNVNPYPSYGQYIGNPNQLSLIQQARPTALLGSNIDLHTGYRCPVPLTNGAPDSQQGQHVQLSGSNIIRPRAPAGAAMQIPSVTDMNGHGGFYPGNTPVAPSYGPAIAQPNQNFYLNFGVPAPDPHASIGLGNFNFDFEPEDLSNWGNYGN